jgi:hypothetical protein
MRKTALELQPNLVRLALGIPAAGVGGLLGYLTAPKAHPFEGMARGAGIGYMTGTGAGIGTLLGDAAAPEGNTKNQNIPYMLTGGLAGGALGLGVGKMMQGPPPWERNRRLREELLAAVHAEHERLKQTEKTALNPALRGLIEAKQLSDRKDYQGKHTRLRQLIEQYPDDFYVDSLSGDIAGITHAPTGFKIHAPLKVLPVTLRGFKDVEPRVA